MKNPRITESEIGMVKRAQAGDESAFSAIFKKYKGFVEHILYSYIHDMDEAKDLTNVVFLKVHNKLSTFTEFESFGGWLRTMSNRVALDYLRSTRRKKILLGKEDIEPLYADPDQVTETDLVNQFLYESLLDEFKKLPTDRQKVLNLFYVEHMTVSQINKALGIPTGTIKSWLSRTRRRVKKQLKIN